MPRGDITGFILAGGRSRRMGSAKAGIAWGRGTLLTHAVERMQQVASPVLVVGAADGSSVPVLPDLFAGRGPLAGIQAALAHTSTDWNLVLAVDMPLVPASLLGFLAEQCTGGALAVLPRTLKKDVGGCVRAGGGPADCTEAASLLQPLCAAYHRSLLPEVERALARNELSIYRLIERLGTAVVHNESSAIHIIDEHELMAVGFSGEMLLNVNIPEDLERARALARTFDV